MLALAQRFQPPQVEENVVFSDAALRDFCIDIGDIINGINPFLQDSFAPFYQNIGCTISGDQINAVTISSHESCGDLYDDLHATTPPASITLRFYISTPRIQGWNNQHEDVMVYFRNNQYEVHYDFQPIGELHYPKEYSTNLMQNEARPIMENIATRFRQKIEATA